MTATDPVRPSPLRLPATWARPRRVRTLLQAAFLGLLAVGGIAGGTTTVLSGENDLAPLVGAAVSPLLLVAAAIGLTRMVWPRRSREAVRAEAGVGLVFDYSRALWVLHALVVVSVLPVAALLLAVGLRQVRTGSAVWGGIMVAVAMAVAVVLALHWVVQALTGRIRRGRVVLTSTEIRHESWGVDIVLPWDDVLQVRAGTLQGPVIIVLVRPTAPPAVTRRATALGGDGQQRMLPNLVIDAQLLSGDPALLLHALAWYHANPGARAALGTATELSRVRSGGVLMPDSVLGPGGAA